MTGVVLGVDNVLFDVGDLEAARVHYRSLGLVERFAMPGLVMFALGDERPGLLVRETTGVEPRAAAGPHVWLEVRDARVWAQERGLEDAARRVRTGWVVESTDAWGNTLGFTDYVDDPPRARPAS